MTTTKNIKGDRKLVKVTLYTPELYYKIPDGLDLEDETVVKWWGYKWGMIHIGYVDGREEEIEAFNEDDERDKNCTDQEIIDDEFDIYKEDEEDDDKPTHKICCQCGVTWGKGEHCDCGCSHYKACEECEKKSSS